MNRLLLAASIGLTLSACSGTPGNSTTGGDDGEPSRQNASSSGSTASTGATSTNGGTSEAASSESQGATSNVVTNSSAETQNSSQAQSGGNSTATSSVTTGSSQGATSSANSTATSSMTTASSGATGAQPVGGPCAGATDCTDGECITSLPGGYCTRSNCGTAGCPTGSTCFDVGNNQSACFADCTSASQCRVTEGYTCDADNSCYPATPSGTGAVGAACDASSDCTDGACLTGLPGGYCTRDNCMTSGCPTGSTCFGVGGGASACFKNCASPSECRTTEGYTCDGDNTCYLDTTPVMCTDMRFEPNESQSAAAVAPVGTTPGLGLCAADRDWFEMPVPPSTIGRLGVTFNNAAGDLDLSAYTTAGACMGGRVLQYCDWTDRSYETGEEFLSVLNGATTQREWAWQLQGYNGAANTYSLTREDIPWTDGPNCTPTYPAAECEGRPNGSVRLIQFPFADPQDPYVGDGYRFDSDSNYRWLRRELIMLVRHAIHETQLRFGGTLPLGLIDMCQRNGITPGYDINNPRHPETTHDQGGNVDIAYYTTLAGTSLPYNQARIVCGPTENNNDGAYCSAAATTQHVVDLPRQVYFMTKIMDHPRLRVIGADQVIAPLLVQEAQRQFGLGWMTQTQRNRWNTVLAYGEGWPYHHHHIHVSMNFWDSGKPGTGPRDGCGLATLPIRDAH